MRSMTPVGYRIGYMVDGASTMVERSAFDGFECQDFALDLRISSENGADVIEASLTAKVPLAMTDFVLIIGVMLFYYAFNLPRDMMSTICAVTMGIVGIFVILRLYIYIIEYP